MLSISGWYDASSGPFIIIAHRDVCGSALHDFDEIWLKPISLYWNRYYISSCHSDITAASAFHYCNFLNKLNADLGIEKAIFRRWENITHYSTISLIVWRRIQSHHQERRREKLQFLGKYYLSWEAYRGTFILPLIALFRKYRWDSYHYYILCPIQNKNELRMRMPIYRK